MPSHNFAIVGAGVIGCAIARELARAGAGRIVVIDRAKPGAEASSAAAGLLVVGSRVTVLEGDKLGASVDGEVTDTLCSCPTTDDRVTFQNSNSDPSIRQPVCRTQSSRPPAHNNAASPHPRLSLT